MKPSELARQIEEWGFFRYCWSDKKKRVTLHVFTPDLDFARRFSYHFNQKLYEYPGPVYAVTLPQRVTAETCYTLVPLFRCDRHKRLAELLMEASRAGRRVKRRQGWLNTKGRNSRDNRPGDVPYYKAVREGALKEAIDLLREKEIYNSCPRRQRDVDKTKQNVVEC